MANVGECLYIASRITAGDRDSWYAEWSTFAGWLVAQAAAAERAGHATSAASLRLRATEYYRQAFFWHRDDLDGKELTTAYRARTLRFTRCVIEHVRVVSALLRIAAHRCAGHNTVWVCVKVDETPRPIASRSPRMDGPNECAKGGSLEHRP